LDSDLERLVHERLQRLPAPRAPLTLRLRVIAAAREERRAPAWAWYAWPLAAQAAFVALLVIAVGGGAWWLSTASAAMGWAMPAWIAGPTGRVVEGARDLQATLEAARIFMTAFLSQPVIWCLVSLVLVMTAACAMFGAMLGRVANFRIQGAD
jgi:hypothetical protein